MPLDTDKQSNQTLAIRLIRVLRYNKARIERTISLLPDRHKALFHALPYLLHVNHESLPGFVAHPDTPHGLGNYTLRPDVARALMFAFPFITDVHQFAKKNWPKRRFIDAVLLMGSVGTIAQDEQSDFDYWVCLNTKQIGEHGITLLQQKLTNIEQWALEKHALEVHFFISDIDKVKLNDFGVADGESAGSAQALFLKSEFYTTNIVVSGKAPFWWLTPNNTTDEQYQALFASLKKGRSPDPDWVMDLGNLEKMDPSELFGAAIWQLSKAMDSPFKSVLKMAKLEVFLENIDSHQPLCNELKYRVHQTNEASSHVEPIDPYALMFDQLIDHYMHEEKMNIVSLLQECLYIKSHAQLSVKLPHGGRNFKHQIMSLYVTRWGWSEDKIRELDNIESWTFAQNVMLSKRIHSFLIQCYRRMSAKFRDLTHTVSKQDMTVLGRRLETFYSKKPNKINILRSGFGEELYCPVATIRSKRMRDGRRVWTLYSGDLLTAPDNEAKPYKVRVDETTTHLIVWCVINKIIDKKTTLLLDYDSEPITETDLYQLTRYAVRLFKPVKVNAIPREQLLAKSIITDCLVVLNFESSRLKAYPDEIAIIYATSWGERYIEFGKEAFDKMVETIQSQDVTTQRYIMSPDYSHKSRLESDFLKSSPLSFDTLDV